MLLKVGVFGSGAVLMALEMLALRLISMNFGGQLREMSAVIAVFLIAMSLGYYLGGRAGDRWPHPLTLVTAMLAAGVCIMPIPLLNNALAERMYQSVLPDSVHALIVSFLLYFLPVVLMAGVSPMAIRLLARQVEESGKVAGNVAALSTLGSILGTLGTSYYLIDLFQSYSKTVYCLGLLMGLLAVVVWLEHVSQRRRLAAAAGLLILLSAPRPAAAEVIYERDSVYHHILVKDEGVYRILYFDNSTESRMLRNDPLNGGYEYTDFFHIPFLLNENIRSVLVVGLGGGTGPKRFVHDYPRAVVDAVDVDQAVVEVAQKYFYVKPGPRLKLHVQDGRAFIKRSTKTYDLIIFDAYTRNRYGSTIPPHLTTREYFQQLRQHLSPRGCLVYNCTGGEMSAITRALYKTIATAFSQQYLFDTETSLNTVFVAWNGGGPRLTKEQFVERAQRLVEKGVVKLPNFVHRAGQLYTGPIDTSDVPLLTDDYAPVDTLMRR
jgi:spermidine synthase